MSLCVYHEDIYSLYKVHILKLKMIFSLLFFITLCVSHTQLTHADISTKEKIIFLKHLKEQIINAPKSRKKCAFSFIDDNTNKKINAIFTCFDFKTHILYVHELIIADFETMIEHIDQSEKEILNWEYCEVENSPIQWTFQNKSIPDCLIFFKIK